MSRHVDVLRRMKDEGANNYFDDEDYVALDAAIAALSAPQLPSGGEVVEPMTGDLLPCPFCGAPAERVDFGPGDAENEGGSCIACTQCQSSGPVEFGYKENFVSNWNRRTAPPSAPVGVERALGVLEQAAKGGSIINTELVWSGDVDKAICTVRSALAHQSQSTFVGVEGPKAYCRDCNAAGMSNCANFDECGGARCITCHQQLNQPAQQPAAENDDAEQLAYCRDDWRKVCKAIRGDNDHMDPDEVVAWIEERKQPASVAPVGVEGLMQLAREWCLSWGEWAHDNDPDCKKENAAEAALRAALTAALAQQPAACRCVDCGGDQPKHDSHCPWMRELHTEQQPAAVGEAMDEYWRGYKAGHAAATEYCVELAKERRNA